MNTALPTARNPIQAILIEDNPDGPGPGSDRFAGSLPIESLEDSLDRLTHEEVDAVVLNLSLPAVPSRGQPARTSPLPVQPLTAVVSNGGGDDPASALLPRLALAAPVRVRVDKDELARLVRYALERKQAELQLIRQKEELQLAQAELHVKTQMMLQAEKMSAVGLLVAGVAHELNNPMMGILNYIQYCLAHTATDDRRYPVLRNAQREVKRCIDIVANLLTFSRMDPEGPEEFEQGSCEEILDRVLQLLSYRIDKEQITVKQRFARRFPPIWMKPNKLQQAFLNLVTNSLESLKDRPTKEIDIEVRSDGEEMRVSISDTGCGIPPEHLNKLFTPFFTSKPPGQGTGLGLAVSFGIIRDHGGEIMCESNRGVGTTFQVVLPLDGRKKKKASEPK